MSIGKDGDVSVSYKITGAHLQQNTNIFLYWATGPSADEILGLAATPLTVSKSTPLNTTVNQVVAHDKFFEPRPAGTSYLLMVADPNNLIDELDETEIARGIRGAVDDASHRGLAQVPPAEVSAAGGMEVPVSDEGGGVARGD